jgi:O-antigen ligase
MQKRVSLNAKDMTDKSVRTASFLNILPAYILFAVIAGAPFPFGSDNPTAIAFWCIVLGFAALTASLSSYRLRPGHFLLLGGIAFIVLCYCFVLHEQLADHPWIAKPHPIWAQASKVLGVPLNPSVSITRGEPFFALGAPLASILALICGLIVGTDRNRGHQLLAVVAWSGAAYAVYGVLSFLIEPTMLLWREKRAYLGSVTGTFINRNTAAAYFGSCAVVWFALLLDQIRRHLRHGPIIWKKVPQRILSKTPRAAILSFSMLFVCLMAMFLTGSRGGVLLSLLALMIAFVVFFRNDLPRRTGIWIALAGSGAVALVLLQFMGGVVSNRFDIQGLADEGRFAAYRSTLRIIADYPWFGTGLGTFAWSFPAYRSPDISMWGVWDIAHNTPLELASEVGLPLAGIVCVGWAVMLAVLIHGIRTRRRDVIIPLAAFAASTIAILHSCIDFSLQIPGYAIVIFALVGVGLAQSFGSKAAESPIPA